MVESPPLTTHEVEMTGELDYVEPPVGSGGQPGADCEQWLGPRDI
jgi:hypothetical protein